MKELNFELALSEVKFFHKLKEFLAGYIKEDDFDEGAKESMIYAVEQVKEEKVNFVDAVKIFIDAYEEDRE